MLSSGHRDHNTDTKNDSTGPAPFPAVSSSSHFDWTARAIPGHPLVHPPPAPARVAGAILAGWTGCGQLELIPSLILSSVHKAQARAELTGPGTSPAIPIQ